MSDDCEHIWRAVDDWEGNPGVPNGVRHFTYYQCLSCGAEQDEKPEDYEPDFYEPDDWADGVH